MRRNRNQHGIPNQPISGNGPLMTNHLRDLDIELELLKRKRDIIQQEQDMLSRGRYTLERQYDYQQPSVSYNRQEPKPNPQQYSTTNYAKFYEGPSNSGNFRPQGIKRPFQGQIWQSSPKRFNAPKNNPWDDSSEQNFQIPQPKPARFSGPVQAPRPSFKKNFQPPPQRKQFQPNKVTKPKPQAVPNKLSTYPVEKTKKLVAQTVKPVNKDSEILRVDIPPTPQMKGRLELALGTIMKEMRQDHCAEKADLECFMAPYVQRMLKHTIRTRIHRLMLNQHIGAFTEIIAIYRNKYPTETDLELIKLARDARDLNKPTHLVWNQIDTDRPEEFFKKNMTRLIHIRLEDMFMKLGDMYKYNTTINLDEYKSICTENNKNKEKDNEDKNNDDKPKTIEEESENNAKTIEDILGQEDGVQIVNDKLSKIKLLSKFVEELFEQNIPKILPKFKDLMVSTLFNDKEFASIKSGITSKCKSKIAREMNIQDTDEQSSPEKDFKRKPIKTSQSTDSVEASAVEKQAHKNEEESMPNSESENNEKVAPQEDETNTAVATESKTAEATENKPAVATENKTAEATENKAEATENKAAEVAVSTEIKPPNTNASSSPAPKVVPSQPNSPASKDILYVKLIGRPSLPARAVIYDFLNKYNPVSIKKHKSLANLLVLGFKDKESFDKVLEANETVVGESTLIIKSSEQINTKKGTPAQNDTNGTPNKSMNTSVDDINISDIEDLDKKKLTDASNDGEDNGTDEGKDKITDDDAVEATNDAEEETKEAIEVPENNDAAEVNVETKQSQEKTSDEKMDSTTVEANLKPIPEDKEDDKSKEPVDKSKQNVKESAPATPTRASSRLANATPRTITTRRTSKLTQN